MRPYNVLLIDRNNYVCQVQSVTALDAANAAEAAELALETDAKAVGYELWLGGMKVGGDKRRPERPALPS